MAALVQARGLTKFYGRHRGISDVTFDLAEGEVFGFLGPNSAGKWWTLEVAALAGWMTLLVPSARLAGRAVDVPPVRQAPSPTACPGVGS